MLNDFFGFVLAMALVGAFLAFVPRLTDYVSAHPCARRRPRRR